MQIQRPFKRMSFIKTQFIKQLNYPKAQIKYQRKAKSSFFQKAMTFDNRKLQNFKDSLQQAKTYVRDSEKKKKEKLRESISRFTRWRQNGKIKSIYKNQNQNQKKSFQSPKQNKKRNSKKLQINQKSFDLSLLSRNYSRVQNFHDINKRDLSEDIKKTSNISKGFIKEILQLKKDNRKFKTENQQLKKKIQEIKEISERNNKLKEQMQNQLNQLKNLQRTSIEKQNDRPKSEKRTYEFSFNSPKKYTTPNPKLNQSRYYNFEKTQSQTPCAFQERKSLAFEVNNFDKYVKNVSAYITKNKMINYLFEERLESTENFKNLIENREYESLTIKMIQFISDLLIHSSENGILSILSQRSSKINSTYKKLDSGLEKLAQNYKNSRRSNRSRGSNYMFLDSKRSNLSLDYTQSRQSPEKQGFYIPINDIKVKQFNPFNIDTDQLPSKQSLKQSKLSKQLSQHPLKNFESFQDLINSSSYQSKKTETEESICFDQQLNQIKFIKQKNIKEFNELKLKFKENNVKLNNLSNKKRNVEKRKNQVLNTLQKKFKGCIRRVTRPMNYQPSNRQVFYNKFKVLSEVDQNNTRVQSRQYLLDQF